MAPFENQPVKGTPQCGCFAIPHRHLVEDRQLGMDAYFAEISLLTCTVCDQVWLRYLFELEAFTASGRWYLGAIDPIQILQLTVHNAKATLEDLDWYFYGGSFFGGHTGRSSGRIFLDP